MESGDGYLMTTRTWEVSNMSIENSALQHTEQVLLTLPLLQNSFVLQNEQRQYVTTNHCSSLLVALWSESGTH
jgi:hypothetical protein